MLSLYFEEKNVNVKPLAVRPFLISTTNLSLGKNEPYLNCCLLSHLLLHFLILLQTICTHKGLIRISSVSFQDKRTSDGGNGNHSVSLPII